MSNKSESTILIPGANGWEIWQGTSEKGFRRTLENGPREASGIEKFPSGRLVMAFPAREALAVPMRVQTLDSGMFEDLASMHLEKSGVRVEQEAGKLTDVFDAGNDGEQSTLLSVVLSAPREGTMPLRSPNEFDLSARMFPMAENAVTIWCELGRWVFAITQGGKLQYFQALPGVSLNDGAAREIKLALTQLSLQGTEFQLDRVIVWTSGTDADPDDAIVFQLGEDLSAEISAEPKPRPVLPERMSKLVPADVRAERRLRAEKQKLYMLIAAVLIVYLGIVGYFGYGYFQLRKQVNQQKSDLEFVQNDYRQIEFFVSDWKELAPVVEERHWPIMLLRRAHNVIPPGQINQLRFKTFESKTLVDQNGQRIWQINIRGEANSRELANMYLEKLQKEFRKYQSDPPPPDDDMKTNRWKFQFEAVITEGELQS